MSTQDHACGAAVRWLAVDQPTMHGECRACGAPVSVADAIFTATAALDCAETALNIQLTEALGLASCTDDPPWDHARWDYYDTSLELKGCRHDWAPPAKFRACVAAMGFSRMWICYDRDGKEDSGMERYYYGDGLVLGGETRADRAKENSG